MDTPVRIAIIIPAAGQSKRFAIDSPLGGKTVSKLDADLDGRPVLLRSVELFANRPAVAQIIVAADPENLDTFKFRWADKLALAGARIVAGGRKERWETVLNAMKAVGDDVTHIAVHDAARPVTSADLIDRVFAAAEKFSAVIPGIAVSATVKRTEAVAAAEPSADPLDAILGSESKHSIEAYRVTDTVARQNLWLIQTPQIFERKLLERAYAQIAAGKVKTETITDDAGLVEALGEAVHVIPGDVFNVKITVPDDLKFAATVQVMHSGRPASEKLGPKRQHPTWAQFKDEE